MIGCFSCVGDGRKPRVSSAEGVAPDTAPHWGQAALHQRDTGPGPGPAGSEDSPPPHRPGWSPARSCGEKGPARPVVTGTPIPDKGPRQTSPPAVGKRHGMWNVFPGTSDKGHTRPLSQLEVLVLFYQKAVIGTAQTRKKCVAGRGRGLSCSEEGRPGGVNAQKESVFPQSGTPSPARPPEDSRTQAPALALQGVTHWGCGASPALWLSGWAQT